jgi:hypothetical protein
MPLSDILKDGKDNKGREGHKGQVKPCPIEQPHQNEQPYTKRATARVAFAKDKLFQIRSIFSRYTQAVLKFLKLR